jgi:hypothetical protein
MIRHTDFYKPNTENISKQIRNDNGVAALEREIEPNAASLNALIENADKQRLPLRRIDRSLHDPNVRRPN